MPRRFTDRDLALFRQKNGEPDIIVPPKPRKSPRAEESRIQCAVIRWWSLKCSEFQVNERMLYAIPNGHFRTPETGAILKREGLRAGAPDLNLDVPRGPFHGLRVEIKTETGVLSREQETFIAALKAQGFCAEVAYGYDKVVAVIERYLKL